MSEVKCGKIPTTAELYSLEGDPNLPGFMYLRLTSPGNNEAWWELKVDMQKPEEAAFLSCNDYKNDLLEQYRQQYMEKEAQSEARS